MTAPWLVHARRHHWRIIAGSLVLGAWLAVLGIVFMVIL